MTMTPTKGCPVWLFLLILLPTAHMLSDRIQEYRNIPFSQEEVDEVSRIFDQLTGVESGGDIIRPFQPQRWWLWRQWSGTVLQQVIPSVATNMLGSFVLVIVLRHATRGAWALGLKPDTSHPLIARLALFDDVWKYLMTLTTFVLTFFVGESYTFFKNM